MNQDELVDSMEHLIELNPNIVNYELVWYDNEQRSETPIFTAARYNNLAAAKMLIARGANVNHVNTGLPFWAYLNETAIFAAAWNANFKMMQLFIDHGADVNHQDFFGSTLAHLATEKKSIPMIQFLLRALRRFPSSFLHLFAFGHDDRILHPRQNLTTQTPSTSLERLLRPLGHPERQELLLL